MDFITPLVIGIIGCLCCIEMCSPVFETLKKHHLFSKVFGIILFHSGRIITYSLLGILFGMLGRGIRLAGFQQWTSILLGTAMIVGVLFSVFLKEQISLEGTFCNYIGWLNVRFKKTLTNRSSVSLFKIGILNGLLPHGLVLIAIAGSISSGDVCTGSLFMTLFGIGTILPLLITMHADNVVEQRIRLKMQRIVPYFVFILGLLFILRGLSLGIPYISPNNTMPSFNIIINKGNCC
jgi:hypothetical protein